KSDSIGKEDLQSNSTVLDTLSTTGSNSTMVVLHFYSSPTELLPVDVERNILRSGKHHVERIEHVYRELCFNVNWTGLTSPSPHDRHKLTWIFQSPFNSQSISTQPFLNERDGGLLVEIGP
ncbi:hypothetical protein scyTo_0021210, partial [Scyliorhinus torazame]|nr:hypothetical protein [Scyliorhinus torazame]